jgi:hypothetical protein
MISMKLKMNMEGRAPMWMQALNKITFKMTLLLLFLVVMRPAWAASVVDSGLVKDITITATQGSFTMDSCSGACLSTTSCPGGITFVATNEFAYSTLTAAKTTHRVASVKYDDTTCNLLQITLR